MKSRILLLILILFFILIKCSNNTNYKEFIPVYDENSKYARWSPDCSKIFFIYDDYFNPYNDIGIFPNNQCDAICYIDSDGKNLNIVDMKNNYFSEIEDFSISRNGDYICFSAIETDNDIYFLYKIPTYGGSPVKLFNDSEYKYNYSPTWSKNDEYIYFVRYTYPGNSYIWKIKPDGNELSKVNIEIDGYIFSISCSNDGEYLLISYQNEKDGNNVIISDVYGSKSWNIVNDPVLQGDISNPCFSPDNKWIAFTNGFNFYITSFNGDKSPYKLTNYDYGYSSPYSPDWSNDGRWILFYKMLHGIFKVEVPDEFLPK